MIFKLKAIEKEKNSLVFEDFIGPQAPLKNTSYLNVGSKLAKIPTAECLYITFGAFKIATWDLPPQRLAQVMID